MIIGIYGASGFGREVLPLARRMASPGTRMVFIDDMARGTLANGEAVFGWDDFLTLDGEKSVAIAIANSHTRQKLDRRCAESGIPTPSLIDPSVLVGDGNQIAEGAILCGYVQVTSNASIGRHFHANIYSYVAHDCVIGDYVTFAPGVHCNGNVYVHDHAYIGTGAILRQGAPDKPLTIGAGAIIGMGAVVTKDVPAGETWVGNPARPLKR
ncbi:acetyltransferase [Altererythrobacter sp. H2]|uniref:acetyltransferase n=1 Tax=Altererythrobacter sp. H2 TaxID=3108391 RepID=UPI002B4BFD68|nr:acetyltransferase [Altererythrobacter sp. H2]WRK95997.1 acetyltransferase [Altererythrobacter sp. H2]